MIRRFLLFIICFVSSACEHQPDTKMLYETLEKKLSDTFGPEYFNISQLTRRGSAVDSAASPDEMRRIVYYDAILELNRDIELCAWNQPGASALVSLMGAGPRSIIGIKANGNQAGDKIVAHGSAIYAHIDGVWKNISPTSYATAEAPAIDSGKRKPVTERLLNTLETITNSVPYTASSTAQRVVQQELERSVTRINGRLTRLQNGYPFTGGPGKSEYLNFSQALSETAGNQQIKLIPLITNGSTENIDLLRNGEAILGLAQGDIALMAYQGKGPFEGYGPFNELRTLGSLYPELVHIVVKQGRNIKNIYDLKGKKISLGPPGSGGRSTIEQVLAAHGLHAYIDYQVVDTPFATAVQQIDNGKIDAATQVMGTPSGPLHAAMNQSNLCLLPLDKSVITKIVQNNSALLALNIAEKTYPNQMNSISTIGTAALILTTSELTMDESTSMVQVIYNAGQDLFNAGSAQGSQVSVKTSKIGITVPMHTGAIEALRKIAHTALPRAVVHRSSVH
ncbi:MAG: TAXI family TRAP transporter solute-binding subunit [Bordetella sp.]|nr:MAG: TAXI family TRAP transporter solute-binding subunit [Bordetella sp.]